MRAQPGHGDQCAPCRTQGHPIGTALLIQLCEENSNQSPSWQNTGREGAGKRFGGKQRTMVRQLG